MIATAIAVVAVVHRPAVAGVSTRPQRYVQIIAHQDDDLLFMNPDLQAGIRAGFDGMTIYLTTGDANTHDPTYIRARQDGALDAYRHMAGGCYRPSIRACYTESNYHAGQLVVQDFTLNANPATELVFVNLPDGYDYLTPTAGNSCSLTRLWKDTTGTTFKVNALNPAGAADVGYNAPSQITHQQLRDALVALLDKEQPTIIRTQDPEPDQRFQRPTDINSCFAETFHDHYDHVAAARFADEAAKIYGGPNGNGRVLVEHYRDYNVSDGATANLSSSSTVMKAQTFDPTYAQHDSKMTTHDRTQTYPPYYARMYYRWPRGSTFVGTNKSGNLDVFAVEDGQVYMWTQVSGDNYRGPINLGNPGMSLTAGIAVGKNADGRLEIFAVAANDHTNSSNRTAHVYTTFETLGGDWVGRWEDLGSPNATVGPQFQELISAAAVAQNGDGRLEIFVKNGGGGISTLTQTAANGGFGTWVDLGGSGVEDAPAATETNDKRIEVFASTTSSLLHWYQPRQNGGFHVDNGFPAVTPASSPAVGSDLEGRVEVFVRQAGTAYLVEMHQTQVGREDNWAPSIITTTGAGAGGVGEPAVANSWDGRVMLFTRNDGTGVSAIWQGAPDGGFTEPWLDLGGLTVNTVSAGITRDGRVVVFYIGIDGRMYANPQVGHGADAAFKSARALGSS